MNRNETIDIAKGIGIILVVVGHLSGVAGPSGHILSWTNSFIYQFHIPIFFFLSGLFFRAEEGWRPFLIKKIKRLYVPYVVANLVFLLIDIALRIISDIDIIAIDDIKHSVKIILGIGLAPLGGATWFLIALFRAVIVYKLVNTICGGRSLFVSIICLAIGALGLYSTSKYAISSSMVAVMFYWLGDFSRKIVFCSDGYLCKKIISAASLALVALILLRPHNSMDVSSAMYENRFFAMAGSCLGIVFILALSSLISKARSISRVLSYVGKNSMSVLIGHFAAFKLVVVVQVMAFGASTIHILSHPCYDVSGLWAIIYLAAGLLIPLAFIKVSQKIVQ